MEEQIVNPLTYKATLKIIDVTLYENLNKENKRLRIHGRGHWRNNNNKWKTGTEIKRTI